MIGVDTADGALVTVLPSAELLKPLRRIVSDLAEKKVNVTQLKLVRQQTEYIKSLGRDLPDLKQKVGAAVPLGHLEEPGRSWRAVTEEPFRLRGTTQDGLWRVFAL